MPSRKSQKLTFDTTSFDRAAHRHAESRMDNRSPMFEVACDPDQRRLGVIVTGFV
jgi:hypothetical protein